MTEDYDFLTDVVINWVKKKKEGESQYGPWTLYNFRVQGDPRYFTYFNTETSPLIPQKGQQLKMLRYQEEEKGGYTNYTVKEMFLDKKSTQSLKITTTPQPRYDSSITMYISYAKDLLVAHMDDNPESTYNSMTMRDLADVVVKTGIYMHDVIYARHQAQPTPKPKPDEPPDFEEPPVEMYDEMVEPNDIPI